MGNENGHGIKIREHRKVTNVSWKFVIGHGSLQIVPQNFAGIIPLFANIRNQVSF